MDQLTESQIKNLLEQNEGTALDFKRDQYKFKGATKYEKSELLKDILAFANTLRDSTAYILIGIDETEDNGNKVTGITEHLEDSSLQEFVNKKTNTPIDFVYQKNSYKDKSVGIIIIPIQKKRPILLNKSYGKVENDKAYIRRGSSTDKATIPEILEMNSTNVSNLCLNCVDNKSSEFLSNPCVLKTVILCPKLTQRKKKPHKSSYFDLLHNHSSILGNFDNQNYVQELIEYVYSKYKFYELGFRLYNPENTLAKNVCFYGQIISPLDVEIKNNYDMPSQPRKNTLENLSSYTELLRPNLICPEIEYVNGNINLKIEFGNVRPNEEILTNTPLYVGSLKEGKEEIEIVGKFLGDNINYPFSCKLKVKINAKKRPMTKEDLKIGF